MTMLEDVNAADKRAAESQQVNGESVAGGSTDAITLPDDPNRSYEAFAAMRAKGPVVRLAFARRDDQAKLTPEERSSLEREQFFVSHYDEVLISLLDHRLSSDRSSTMTQEQLEKLPPVIEELKPLLQSLNTKDPPYHTRLRRLIQPSFSVQVIEATRPRIQKIADDLLDKAERAAAERGETRPNRRMDLIEAFAYPLPVIVISDMFGIPMEDREQVMGWTEGLLEVNRGRARRANAGTRADLRQFIAYLRDLCAAKRKHPEDDVISQLLQAEEEGDRLNEDEVLSAVFTLYMAGHMTTVNLIGNGVLALIRHPGELAKLRADPGLTKGAVEEILRYYGPVDYLMSRVATENIELGGKPISKGEPVMVGLASANRDPAHFEDPDRFDITRANADQHVTFGRGIHMCVGARLARLEGQIAFDTLLRRLPEMRLTVDPEELRWSKASVPHLSHLRGVSNLPLLF